jgi:superfamily II DNA or RNA helicase
MRRPGDPPPRAYERQRISDALARMERAIRAARDAEPFTAEARDSRARAATLLRAAGVETRRAHNAWLPAKLFLSESETPVTLAGSSNLSPNGLAATPALNVAAPGDAIAAEARAWFDALWHEAEPFDLAALFAEPDQAFPPWLIFLRMLLAIYGDELAAERDEAGQVPLTAFQLHGVWRAQRIMRDHGGVLIADEVGLGKTFIGAALLEACDRRRQRALLVCPAAVYANWERALTHASRRVRIVSFDQLARDRRFADDSRPLATGDFLKGDDPDDYAMVVVDEAHNYRNPDAPYRAGVLRALLAGERRKQLVLLTATPVNNSLYDLRNLMQFFLAQDAALAAHGVVSLRETFRRAARKDPADLSPDELFPVIDAVTVKRTRAFVKRHYPGETIRGADGVLRPIVFPKPVASSIRYPLPASHVALFDALADALDPETGANLLRFARYAPDAYRRDRDEDDSLAAENAAGLLRSGLLKRFESSLHAFRLSLARMIAEHDRFIQALDRGRVISTAFLRELDGGDDDAFDALLADAENSQPADAYDTAALRAEVERDAGILRGLAGHAGALGEDPKLAALVEELAAIAAQAATDAAGPAQQRRNRKVLLFSSYADTVVWLRQALAAASQVDQRLAAYRNRIAAVAGSGLVEEPDRENAAQGFAPETAGGGEDLYDLLITTDVLAEGVNLQQCRNIINVDLPWNPMRLVQRHGRIDRIGSPHPRVYLRSVFPADRLEAMLTLESRIQHKLAQAGRSIGVAAPLDGAEAGQRVFAETRAEIEKLANGDASLFEQGGTTGAVQSGEEYRQLLRAALARDRARIEAIPGHAGSGMRKGSRSGVLFCVEVATRDTTRAFLRFVPADADWLPARGPIIGELATCLRLAECSEDTPRVLPDRLRETVFAFWQAARDDVFRAWQPLTDPATLQPKVALVNRQVATLLRTAPPVGLDAAKLALALDILEAPWPPRDEAKLRQLFRDDTVPQVERAARLVALILGSGLPPFRPPPPMPPIGRTDIQLVCWLAISASD